MKPGEVLQLVIYFTALLALTPLLGGWMAKVFAGERQFLSSALGWLERLIYRIARVDAKGEMSWGAYLWAALSFNIFGLLALLGLQLGQAWLPLNPAAQPNVDLGVAVNTAISFIT